MAGAKSHGQVRALPASGRTVVLALMLASCAGVLYLVARPLYWRFYAEFIHSYEPDPALTLIRRAQEAAGGDAAAALSRLSLKEPTTLHGADHSSVSAVTAAAAIGNASDGIAGRSVDLSKLSMQQLERLKERAREKQWEDEWWRMFVKKEAEKRARDAASSRSRERESIAAHNISLTKEAVHRIARNGLLFVTWANHHYTDFALSWVQHLQAANVTNFMVGAMDSEILASLAKRGIPTFRMDAGLTTGDFGWGSPTFAKMGRKKINLIAQFLKLDVQVIISDVDVMWLRDPQPFFQRFPDADVLTSTDHLTPTVGAREELEMYAEAGSAFNIGIMLFRKRSLPFVEEWVRVIEADDKIWDQNAFNDLARRGQVINPDDPNHYFKGDNGTLTVGILPLAYFASGHVFFTQRLHRTLGIRPYAVHATFQFSGTPGKRNRFREAGLWHDKYEYYRARGGFLAYTPSMPKALLDAGGPRTHRMDVANTVGHFALINHQLRELRNALALATVLGRTLVLPPLWCGLDRYWAPHAGTVPGSNFTLPFLCPADHVLDLEGGLARNLEPLEEYGPNIDFRESSFLSSKAIPAAVLASAARVMVCTKGKGYCPEPDAPGTVDGDKVFLQEGLKSEQIKMVLSSVSHVAVLRFSSMTHAFGNFSDAADWSRFVRRINHYSSVWCCIDAHPGHIHYDFLWDMPHTDKFGRAWTSWEPRPGP